MSLLKKLAGETVMYGVSSILSRLLHFVILLPYFTNTFETGEYGIVSDLFVYAGILMVIYTYRMETAFFRFASRDENFEKAFSTATIAILVTTSLFTLSMFALLRPISEALLYPDNLEYIAIVVLIIAFDALAAIPFARLRLENRPVRFAIIKTLNIVVNIIFVFLFLEVLPSFYKNEAAQAASFFNTENKILFVFIANLIASATVLGMLSPMYKKVKWQFDKALFKKMFRYAAPLIIVGLAAAINQLIAIPLLKYLLPGTVDENFSQAGIYSAAAKMAVLMNLFTQAFNYAAEPFFFKNANRSDSKEMYASVAQTFTLVGAFAFLVILLYLDVIKLFLGKDFREGLEVIPILLMAYLFLGLYYNFSIWYKLTDKTSMGAYISIGGVIITLAINFSLIPNPAFGYVGAAWAAFGCYAFMATMGYLTGQKYHPIPYPIWNITLYILLAIGGYWLSEYFATMAQPTLFIRLVFNTLILLIFVGSIFLLEKKSFQKMLK
jgi:O-antigen/teichoic acid export membrane protein